MSPSSPVGKKKCVSKEKDHPQQKSRLGLPPTQNIFTALGEDGVEEDYRLRPIMVSLDASHNFVFFPRHHRGLSPRLRANTSISRVAKLRPRSSCTFPQIIPRPPFFNPANSGEVVQGAPVGPFGRCLVPEELFFFKFGPRLWPCFNAVTRQDHHHNYFSFFLPHPSANFRCQFRPCSHLSDKVRSGEGEVEKKLHITQGGALSSPRHRAVVASFLNYSSSPPPRERKRDDDGGGG